MNIGAKTQLDQMLVDQYTGVQTTNINSTSNMAVPPERMMESMQNYYNVQRAFLGVKVVQIPSTNNYKRTRISYSTGAIEA